VKRQGAKRKAADLLAWLETVLHLYGERVLAFDSETAQVAGALSDLARGRGHSPGLADVIIAATAQVHGLTILSRNERHFMPMDATVIDPFRQLVDVNAVLALARPSVILGVRIAEAMFEEYAGMPLEGLPILRRGHRNGGKVCHPTARHQAE
jgi:hypothetical protein